MKVRLRGAWQLGARRPKTGVRAGFCRRAGVGIGRPSIGRHERVGGFPAGQQRVQAIRPWLAGQMKKSGGLNAKRVKSPRKEEAGLRFPMGWQRAPSGATSRTDDRDCRGREER